jgi:hypothetical protein
VKLGLSVVMRFGVARLTCDVEESQSVTLRIEEGSCRGSQLTGRCTFCPHRGILWPGTRRSMLVVQSCWQSLLLSERGGSTGIRSTNTNRPGLACRPVLQNPDSTVNLQRVSAKHSTAASRAALRGEKRTRWSKQGGGRSCRQQRALFGCSASQQTRV